MQEPDREAPQPQSLRPAPSTPAQLEHAQPPRGRGPPSAHSQRVTPGRRLYAFDPPLRALVVSP
eukprot:15442898-Alexandrium_andersonii.AAC.1